MSQQQSANDVSIDDIPIDIANTQSGDVDPSDVPEEIKTRDGSMYRSGYFVNWVRRRNVSVFEAGSKHPPVTLLSMIGEPAHP